MEHSDVCYVQTRNSRGEIEYRAVRKAKPYKNDYGLDLFVTTADVVSDDGSRKISRRGSITDGVTGMKLCDVNDFEDCINRHGIEKIKEMIAKAAEKNGQSPRYTRPDEKKSDVFPQKDEVEAPKSVLLTPLFDNYGNFNSLGKRTRMRYLKTVSSGNAKFDLYTNSSKHPDRDYVREENDRFYLHALINGYAVPCSITEYELEDQVAERLMIQQLYGSEEKRIEAFRDLRRGLSFQEAEKRHAEQVQRERGVMKELKKDQEAQADYLNETLERAVNEYIKARDGADIYPSFVGAAVIGDLEKCVELADAKKRRQEQERVERKRKASEQERVRAEEDAKAEAELIRQAEEIFINGGVINNGRIICKIADKQGVTIPLRTRGWILNDLASCTIGANGVVSYSFYRSKNGSGSMKIYDVLGEIRTRLLERTAN